MISSLYFLSLILLSFLSIYLLDNLKIKNEHKPYLEGLVFGIIAVLGLNIHYYYVEPTAVFPKINIFLSHSSLIALSFFLFGFKAGLITLMFLFIARLFLTNEFLAYSLVLIILSAVNGFYFHKLYKNNSQKSVGYKTIFLFVLSQSFISLLIFLIGPVNAFQHNYYQMLIYLIPIITFLNLIIAMGIIRTRYQKNLFLNLNDEKKLLSNVLYNLSDAVIIVDNQLNVLRVNNLAETLTGYKSSEIYGKKLSEICFLKDKLFIEKINNQIENIGIHEIITHSDITIISKTGEEISIDCRISSANENDYQQKIYVILFRDIRELKKSRKLLEDSEKRFRQFFDFSLEGIWRYEIKKPVDISLPAEEQIKLFFENGYLAECNDVFAQMYGFKSKDELIGSSLRDVLIEEDENNVEYLKNFIKNNYRLANAESVEKDKDGNIKYFVNSLYGIIENGYILGAWGIQIDVTEEKLITKQVRDNNKLLISILNAPKGIIIFSLDKNYCYTAFSISHKETMKKIWGVDIEIGMNMLDCIKLEVDRLKAKNNFDKTLNGEHLNLIEEYGDEDLFRTWWIDNYSPIYDGADIIGLAVYVTDITQQKAFEAELEKKNLLLTTLMNTIPDSIYVKDKNLRKILTNKTDLYYMGYENQEDVLGKTDDEIYSEEFAKISIEDDRNVIAGRPVINREEKIITKNGEEIYILTTKVPMYNNEGEIVGLVGIGRDITENKLIQKKITESEQKLKVLFNQSFQLMGLLSPVGILLDVNQTACDFAGTTINKVINKPFVETPWWAHSKVEQDKLKEAIKSASLGNFFRMETTHINKDNQIRIIDFSLTSLKNIEGNVEYLIAEGRDITDFKELQSRLIESENKYRTLFEASMDAILVVNAEGIILLSNEKHKSLFNSLSQDFDINNLFNLIHKDDSEKIKFEIKLILSGKIGTFITIRLRKNESEYFWGDLSINKFTDIEGNILFICVLRDITYKKQIEDELKKRVYELEQINRLMVGRELKMIELKREVNSLLKQLGLPTKYTENDI